MSYQPKMEFFTPELILEFNSEDDTLADRADNKWEKRTELYEKHLKSIMDKMVLKGAIGRNPFSSFYPHDWQFVSLKYGGVPSNSFVFLTLKEEFNEDEGKVDYVATMIYNLCSPPIETPCDNQGYKDRFCSPGRRKEFIYDEFHDKETFEHRILFNDGSVLTLPFNYMMTNLIKIKREL